MEGDADQTWDYSEESVTDDYVTQALEALMACGDRTRLGFGVPPPAGTEDTPREAAMRMLAQSNIASARRLMYARTAILFTALAAEAQINHFLYLLLPNEHVAAVERLRTPAKYLVGPRMAMGADLFATDAEPMGQIRRLFKLRNALAHPTVQRHRVKPGGFIDTEHPVYRDYNPETAAGFLLAVSQAAVTLAQADGATASLGGFAQRLLALESELREWSRHFRDELPRAPTPLAQLLRGYRTKGAPRQPD
jgi:hypothetical protein